MRRGYGHRHALGLTIVLLHVSTLVLGSLRVCWSDAHTHGGHPGDCAMHHLPDDSAPHYGHHGHNAGTNDSARGDQQITCRCANDLASPYAGPDVVLGAPTSLFLAPAALRPAAGDRSPAQVWLSTLSPPPRVLFSALT
jgi:hypothetical protein